MDCSIAINYLKEKERMCNSTEGCYKCPIVKNLVEHPPHCMAAEEQYPEETIAIVQEWSDKNQPNSGRRRINKLLEIFPNISLNKDGYVHICPAKFDSSIKLWTCGNCAKCKEKYWLGVYEEEEK